MGSNLFVSGDKGDVLTSTNGIKWNIQTSVTGYSLIWCCIYNNGEYILYGQDGTILTSINATTWAQLPIMNNCVVKFNYCI